jgi:hypothetical protein
MLLKALVALMILMSYSSGWCAEETKNKKQKSKHKTNVVETKDTMYSTEPIDFNTDKFPPKYLGHDIAKLSSKLENAFTTKKSEYETTEQYNSRIAEQRKKPLIGSIGIDDYFVLVLTSKDKSLKHEISGFSDYFPQSIRSEYDADNKKLNIDIIKNACFYKGDILTSAYCLTTYYGVFASEFYTAGNAMGATIQVEKYSQTAYSLLLDNSHFAEEYTIINDVDVATAIKLKDELALAVVFKVKDPYVKKGWFYTQPTLKEPRESQTAYTSVAGIPVAFWYFNFNTGKIIKKIDFAKTVSVSKK